ncbi:acetylxylan esterase [Streptomyces sp. NPDC102405]|uniref:acetylxylan esterase n=1 Tax=Streptomyces sp. NPDC102405 TaxID=3366170 RepID=UPI0038091596
MPLTDQSYEDLVDYRPELTAPEDFDAFWQQTLAEARTHSGAPTVTPVPDSLLTTIDVFDVRFPGWNGEPVAAWLLLPKGGDEPLPTIVHYIGYSGGRGLPTDHLLPPSAGYAHLVVDSRGQGHDTPDRDEGSGTQWVQGFMTRGIEDPRHHYYRRLITDCVRAVDAATQLPRVDPERIIVAGGSQGGGLSLAVAGLASELVAAAMPDVPFLCHYRRAADISGEGPYVEIAGYLRHHSREKVETAFATLAYFDGVHFAARATVPALFSVGLMDPICPPSTVYAAFNRYAGEDRAISVWRFADHGGGYGSSARVQLEWLRERGLAPKSG